ncbi:MAG: J domain-containing protein [Planctomycetales bacterium]|nr:J domain-containing protein [Planctomycetales bacterium]
MGTDYYELLNVSRLATHGEIHAAYLRLAGQLHPDLNGADPVARDQFKLIVEAYKTLHDPEQRRRYDLGIPGKSTPNGYARRPSRKSAASTAEVRQHATRADVRYDNLHATDRHRSGKRRFLILLALATIPAVGTLYATGTFHQIVQPFQIPTAPPSSHPSQLHRDDMSRPWQNAAQTAVDDVNDAQYDASDSVEQASYEPRVDDSVEGSADNTATSLETPEPPDPSHEAPSPFRHHGSPIDSHDLLNDDPSILRSNAANRDPLSRFHNWVDEVAKELEQRETAQKAQQRTTTRSAAIPASSVAAASVDAALSTPQPTATIDGSNTMATPNVFPNSYRTPPIESPYPPTANRITSSGRSHDEFETTDAKIRSYPFAIPHTTVATPLVNQQSPVPYGSDVNYPNANYYDVHHNTVRQSLATEYRYPGTPPAPWNGTRVWSNSQFMPESKGHADSSYQDRAATRYPSASSYNVPDNFDTPFRSPVNDPFPSQLPTSNFGDSWDNDSWDNDSWDNGSWDNGSWDSGSWDTGR